MHGTYNYKHMKTFEVLLHNYLVTFFFSLYSLSSKFEMMVPNYRDMTRKRFDRLAAQI